MFTPTREETDRWESRIDTLTEALPLLEEALDLLRQPLDTDETILLEDLILSLKEERGHLETWLFGIEDD